MTATKTKTAKKPAEKPSKLCRLLSTVFLINSTEFAKAAPVEQTKTLTAAAGKPVLFVESFVALGNKTIIRDGLLAGKDVSRELEFNGIVLDPAEIAALKAVQPVLTKIADIGPNYPWRTQAVKPNYDITFEDNRVRRNGHYIGKAAAQAIWKRASFLWSGGKKPVNHSVSADGAGYGNRSCAYDAAGIVIGCQQIPRTEVEYIALHYDWEPNIFIG